MKVLILNLLISYALSLTTTNRQSYNLKLYNSLIYDGNYASFSVLNISEYQEEKIYISYYIKRDSFGTRRLNYAFTDNYPNENFECTNHISSSTSSTNSSGQKKNNKITSIRLYFEIEK